MKLSLITNKSTVQSATSDVVIEHDENGIPKAGFKIVGPDSIQHLTEQVAQRVAGRKRNAVHPLDMKTDEGQKDFDRIMQGNMSGTANAVVVDWFGFENDDGTAAAFDHSAVAAIFEAKPSLRDKVIIALDKEADFLPKAEAA